MRNTKNDMNYERRLQADYTESEAHVYIPVGPVDHHHAIWEDAPLRHASRPVDVWGRERGRYSGGHGNMPVSRLVSRETSEVIPYLVRTTASSST